ncbi:hypothetical protein ACN64G_04810 [Streptococcus hyovaginalis]
MTTPDIIVSQTGKGNLCPWQICGKMASKIRRPAHKDLIFRVFSEKIVS